MSNTLAHAYARRALAAMLLLLSCAADVRSRQTQAPTQTPAKDPATISGRVTSNGKPAREVPVVLTPADWVVQRETIAKGVTDEEGRYKLTNVPPGRYHLTAVSPGYVFAEGGANEWQQGKVVNVSAGDVLKDLDFTLVRGGVVTGRVTDSDGRAVVEEVVTLMLADARVRKEKRVRPFTAATDDRGVYRAWGVMPGRYVVYSGRAREDIFNRGVYDAGAFYPQTFYPSVAEESQARVVEVTAGGEEDEVDITLSKLTKNFVTGVRRGTRAADANASAVRLGQGEQVSDVTVTAAYGAASVAGRVSFPACEGCANPRARLYLVPQERERAEDLLRYSEASVEGKGREGEFSFEGVAPGRYTLVALPEPARMRGAPERPAFLDADSRARLRREAEARGTRLTLAPCEHSEGVAVSYAP